MGKWLRKIDDWTNQHRPTALLIVVVLTIGVVGLLNWTTGSDLWQQLFYPERDTVADVRFWSALVSSLAFAMGLPVAFLLWLWRDRNVRDQIEEQRKQVENARKDVNLKEFQEVQSRAAGALDRDKLSPEAREQLQIAALHQLQGFITEDFGSGFQRAAIELLFAGHRAALETAGTADEWAAVWSYRDKVNSDWAILDGLRAKFHAKLCNADRARMEVITKTWDYISDSGVSLSDRRFDLLSLAQKNFHGLMCLNSTFFGADLRLADFSAANLKYSKMHAAYLHEADFAGADISSTQFHGATLDGATFDDESKLSLGWDEQNDARRTMERKKFRGLRTRHINDPPLEGPNFIRGKNGRK